MTRGFSRPPVSLARRGHLAGTPHQHHTQASHEVLLAQSRFSLTAVIPLEVTSHLRVASPCIIGISDPVVHICRRRYSSATPRKRKAAPKDGPDEEESLPTRSTLFPPKLPPSVWQIFFTDWLERKNLSQEGDDKKLNVAQAAKEAGDVYNNLTDEQRAELKQRALPFKDQYEREFAAWKRTLTPTDIAHENAFRTAQRKSGKSRLKNLNDPNAPKRPPGAYLMFLQAVRADPRMAEEVFGEATEMTRQSVLGAVRWRSMGDEEKRPYFEQAENAQREYEVEREAYEQAHSSHESHTVTSVLVYPASSIPAPKTLENKGDGDV